MTTVGHRAGTVAGTKVPTARHRAPRGWCCLTRPYFVYRSRDERLGMNRPRRGWERTT
ncbi:hypothetical protein GWI34_18000 [Actinomadura sp. DSM 109109]|nr:hypothetical protein [Actinomadura lepetitiana]